MLGMAGEEVLTLLKPCSFGQKPVDTRQFTHLLIDLLEDRTRDAQLEEAASARTILGRGVQVVFGECEPTAARKMGVIVNALVLLGAVGFLAIG